MTSGAFHSPVPEDRALRLRLAMDAALDALGLAVRESKISLDQPASRRWVALGLTSALQGALVAALSRYETAELDAVLDPSHPDRIAPVALLLRRARSAEYLDLPDRVELSASAMLAIERVIAVRNAAVHAIRSEVPASFAADVRVVTHLLRHLLTAPTPAHQGGTPLQSALAQANLDWIEAALGVAD